MYVKYDGGGAKKIKMMINTMMVSIQLQLTNAISPHRDSVAPSLQVVVVVVVVEVK